MGQNFKFPDGSVLMSSFRLTVVFNRSLRRHPESCVSVMSDQVPSR